MKPIYRHTLFALALAAMPGIALAEDAFTMQQTDIFAGPSSDFPQIASLPPNAEVGVAGCLSDWSWCDVTFANARGWVWAGDLGYPYEGRRVAIIEFGPRLHLPAVTFSLNTYWDEHYRSRPFYGERNVWVSRVHVEGGHGGKAPHGGTRVASPGGGAQPSAGATVQGRAQAQGAEQQQRSEQGAQAEQRSREQAQSEQRSRDQAKAQSEQQRSREQAQHPQPSPQANQGARPQEDMAKSRERPEASRSAQTEQRSDQGTRGMTQAQPQRQAQTPQDQHESRNAAQNTGRGEATRPEPDRGANAKGPQNEASRAQPDRGASAKGPQGERPKEEGKESNQQ